MTTPFQKLMGKSLDPDPSKSEKQPDLDASSISTEETGADHFADFSFDDEPDRDAGPGASDAAEGMSGAEMEGLVTIMQQVLGIIGGAICVRYEVPALTDDELKSLGTASGNVAQFYMANPTPIQAAWIGLGMVGIGVAMPRVQVVRARRVAKEKAR